MLATAANPVSDDGVEGFHRDGFLIFEEGFISDVTIEVLRAALGRARDEDYLDYFVRCKRREWQQAHEQITQWEIDRYLQLF